MTDAIEVTFTVRLDRDAIHARGLDAWINDLALLHDADVSTWPEVYHTIALDFLSGGEMSDMILDQGSSHRIVPVTLANDDTRTGPVEPSPAQVWDTETNCPGTPHRGHTKHTAPCPLDR